MMKSKMSSMKKNAMTKPMPTEQHRIDDAAAQLVQVIEERHLAAHLIVGGSLQVVRVLDQVVVRHRSRRVASETG